MKDFKDYAKTSAALKKNWLTSLKNKFEKGGSDSEPSDLNSGIIGHTFDMLANEVEDAFFMLNTKSREIFPSVARLPNSLYMHAAAMNITDFYAQPSSAEVLIGIRVTDIQQYAVLKPGTSNIYELEISGDTEILIDKTRFLISHPVIITYKPDVGVISAAYDSEYLYEIPYDKMQSAYVQSVIQGKDDNDRYFVFKVKVYNLIKNIQEFKWVPKANDSDEFIVPFNGQLHDFCIFYRANNALPFKRIQSIYAGTLHGAPKNEVFCYYAIEDGQYTISFTNNPRYVLPKFNSDIQILTFVTDGAAGNFKYTGEDIYVKNVPNKDIPRQYATGSLNFIAQLLHSDIKGGKDVTSLEELRDMIITKKSSRNSIISDNDLEKFFKSRNLTVRKYKDDFLSREYMTYLLLKNPKSKDIIPSRCATVIVDTKENNNADTGLSRIYSIHDSNRVEAYMLTPKALFKNYRTGDNTKDVKTGFYVVTNPAKDKTAPEDIRKAIYKEYIACKEELLMCPLMLKVFRDPYFVGVYNTACNISVGTTFEFSNTSVETKYSVSKLNVVKHNVWDDEYIISCEVMCSNEHTLKINDEIRVLLELIPKEGDSHVKSNFKYIQLFAGRDSVSSSDSIIFIGKIKISNVFNAYDEVKITGQSNLANAFAQSAADKELPLNSEIITTVEDTDQAKIKYGWLPFSSKIRIGILVQPTSVINSVSEKFAYFNTGIHESGKNFVLGDTFVTDDYVRFIEDMSDSFAVDFDIVKNAFKHTENGKDVYTDGFVFRNVPMVSYFALNHPLQKYMIYDTLKHIHSEISNDIVPYLTQSTRVRVGVYNTIGESELYRHIIYRGKGTGADKLENLSISLSLNVKLKTNENEEFLKADITKFVTEYISDIMSSGSFYADRCIQAIKSKFVDIEYVEFDAINKISSENIYDGKQTIVPNKDVNSDKCVPEYILLSNRVKKEDFITKGDINYELGIYINII